MCSVGKSLICLYLDKNTTLMEIQLKLSEMKKAGVDINEKYRGGCAHLILASARNQNPEIITELIKAGAEVNAKAAGDFTPLILAVSRNSNQDVIIALIKGGADVNAKKEDGFTPLMAAALFNYNHKLISALVKAGADIDARCNDGRTALDYAMKVKNIYAIAVLQKKGDVLLSGKDYISKISGK